MRRVRDLVCVAGLTATVGVVLAATPSPGPVAPAAPAAPQAGSVSAGPAAPAAAERKVVAPRAVQQDAQYWFGVEVMNVPTVMARQLKLRGEQGLMVMSVMPSSPALKVGLQAGDLLLEINGSPLSSQEDLARAANLVREADAGGGGAGGAGVVIQASAMTYMRDGDRREVKIMPEPRPEKWMVTGANTSAFSVSGGRVTVAGSSNGPGGVAANAGSGVKPAPRTYELNNGTTAMVWPGYRFNFQVGSSGVADGSTLKSVQALMEKGQTVILSQEMDTNGAVKRTISAGGKSYPVEAGKLEVVPAELRPLAQSLLTNVQQPASQGTPGMRVTAAARGNGPVSTDDLLKAQAKEIQDLQLQVRELTKRMGDLIDAVKKPVGNGAAEGVGKQGG